MNAGRLACGLSFVFMLTGALAFAEPANKQSSAQVASSHYETGLALFELKRFEEAVSEFRKAYEVEARADFLLHIGRSYEQLQQVDKALYFFKRFLQTAPASDPFRAEVEDFVAKNDTPPNAPSNSALLTSDAPALLTDAPAKPHTQPVWHQWWFWTALGAAAVLVGGTSYVLLRDTNQDPPSSALGHMRFE
ncbi:MAG: tetratricopeptide repeat protein [Deltaproteobacteria bacterium]|nr:tetratricopeptide repeat protein [Deltaproteobacteria bacterium]